MSKNNRIIAIIPRIANTIYSYSFVTGNKESKFFILNISFSQ